MAVTVFRYLLLISIRFLRFNISIFMFVLVLFETVFEDVSKQAWSLWHHKYCTMLHIFNSLFGNKVTVFRVWYITIKYSLSHANFTLLAHAKLPDDSLPRKNFQTNSDQLWKIVTMLQKLTRPPDKFKCAIHIRPHLLVCAGHILKGALSWYFDHRH